MHITYLEISSNGLNLQIKACFLFRTCVLPGKGCWWRPRARTAPAVANVVATRGSAEIHAFSAPPPAGPIPIFLYSARVTPYVPVGNVSATHAKSLLFQWFSKDFQ